MFKTFLKHLSSSNERQSEINKQLERNKYLFVRAVNQFLNAYNAHTTKDPYAPHILFDKNGILQLINGDASFSPLDLKYPGLWSAYKFLHKKLEEISKNSPDFLIQIIQELGLQQGNHIQELCRLIRNYIKQHTNTESKIKCTSQYPIVKMVHQFSAHKSDLFITNEAGDVIGFSTHGLQYLSGIVSEIFTMYDHTSALGKHRKEYVFPNQTYYHLYNKITYGEILSESDFHNLIQHLIRDPSPEEIAYLVSQTNVIDTSVAREEIKTINSHILNMLYSALIVEQSYDHYKVCELTKERYQQPIIHYHNDEHQYFTKRGSKSLTSMSKKEFRSNLTNDKTRCRTWVPDELLHNNSNDDRLNSLYTIFVTELQALQDTYTKNGHTMHLTSLVINNKYCDFTSFSKQEISTLQNLLCDHFGISSNTSLSYHKQSLPTLTINYDYCATKLHGTPQQIQAIQESFNADHSKPGGNGGYEDIKICAMYELEDIHGNTIQQPGGYEHQIVHFSSKNEGGLASHPLILEPRKNITTMLRNKGGQMTIDEFTYAVHGGLNVLLEELGTRHDRLQDSTWDDNIRASRSYIELQFNIRNTIPEELRILTSIPQDMTYIDIAGNFLYKTELEKAVEKHILRGLLQNRTVLPYLYVNTDNKGSEPYLNQITDIKKEGNIMNISVDTYVSWLLDEGLLSTNQPYKNFFRICGGGSGNLTKSLMNATLSEEGYIGVPYNDGDTGGIMDKIVFIKVPKMANIVYHSIGSDDFHNFPSVRIDDFATRIEDALRANNQD